MYAKVFRQIYDSTLAEDWRTLVTFQQFLVLADSDGIVDMTPGAIHRTTNIPRDIIDAGIEKLQQPDPNSRSEAEEGRRIVLIDSDRNWGWRVVNYEYYRGLASKEDKKEKDRLRIAEKRKQNSDVASSRSASPKVADVAHTDTDTDTDTEAKAKGKEKQTPEGLIPPGLNMTAWSVWLEFRKEIRKPLKQVSIPAAQRKLAAFGDDQEAVVEQSIANGWTGLFPLPSSKSKQALSDHNREVARSFMKGAI